MKQVNVIIKNRTTLELIEDANRGDEIDLKAITKLDTTSIEEMIENNTDKVYQKKLDEFAKALNEKHSASIKELTKEIENLKHEHELNIQIEKNKITNNLNNQINDLTSQIKALEASKESAINQVKLEVESKYKKEITELSTKLETLTSNNEKEMELLMINHEVEKENALLEQKAEYDKIINEKDITINKLQYLKSIKGSKVIGEDFETWCNNEVESYMQNGFQNCTWEKDNETKNKAGSEKSTKADYLFRIYANEEHLPNELLASICVEMKDENPETKKKQKNSTFYDKLNENREKKNCKYALLVSNLEMDDNKFVNIYKVPKYNDMYVVRPENMMSFLNMIVSLTTRFADLIESNKLQLQNKVKLIELFEKFKDDAFNKPLSELAECVKTITKSSEAISKANNAINAQCDIINRNFINTIKENIANFKLKIESDIVPNLN